MRGCRCRYLSVAVGLAALFVGFRVACAETLDDTYRLAIKDYYAGRYARSADRLERMAGLPLRNEELYYNLGCAYYRLGKLGPAIYAFERALTLDPSFEDARYNLSIARERAASRVKDVIKGATADMWWIQLLKLLSLRGWWVAVLALWWLVIGIVLALRFVGPGPARAGLLAANGLLVVLLICSALGLGGRIHLVTGTPEAVILPDKVTAREGPDSEARPSFQLHAGLRIRVKDRSAGWIRVRLANGLDGWIPQGQAGVL